MRKLEQRVKVDTVVAIVSPVGVTGMIKKALDADTDQV